MLREQGAAGTVRGSVAPPWGGGPVLYDHARLLMGDGLTVVMRDSSGSMPSLRGHFAWSSQILRAV